MTRACLRHVVLGAVLAALALGALAQAPLFDLFIKSDYGRAKFWLNTSTGEFHWEDTAKKLDVSGRGTLAFPNLGPLIFSYAGPAPGYDWVSISLKIYGTTATGYLAAFPEGAPVRKVVSNFYDKDTRNDAPGYVAPKRKQAPPPEIKDINPRPSEVPSAPQPAPAPPAAKSD